MNRKIVGFVFCILLIISVLPATGFNTYYGPHVEIIWPPDNYETDQSTITLTGYAGGEFPINEYGYTILYPGGGVFSEFWSINPPVEYYEFEISINLVEGEQGNLITVYAEDTNADQGTDEVTVIYTPGGEDTEPPEVVITYPEYGQYFLNPDINLQGYITDNVGISKFTVYNYWNDQDFEIHTEYFSDSVTSYEFDLAVTLNLGVNNIVITAFDESNNEGEDTVQITHSQCTHDTPIIGDNSGETRFHGIFVGCDHFGIPGMQINGAERSAEAMFDYLRTTPGWNDSDMELLLGEQATWGNIKNAFVEAKRRAQPGDEFLFYFCDHGGNRTIQDDSGEEPDGFDENLFVSGDRQISDDILTEWISGFPDCVTITVKLDCCYSGGFFDGDDDLQNATNADNETYGPDHINIEAACGANETTNILPYYWDDDGDVLVEPGELYDLEQWDFEDDNGNGEWDQGEDWWWWIDKDEDGEVDEGELVDPMLTPVRIGNFTKANLDALEVETSSKGLATTKADRNKDGITTTKELYEYSINALYFSHYGDNDNDGQIDEDGPDYIEENGQKKQFFKDNDGDGLIDEDPAPSSFAFWYDEAPSKPSKPIGEVEGKPGEEYIYSTMSTDPEYDDIYYWFDWGDGSNSGWLGPYSTGQPCNVEHSWDEKGNYQIKVKSRDRCYAESPWSDPLIVTMPKNKVINLNVFLQILFQRFPFFEKILKQMV